MSYEEYVEMVKAHNAKAKPENVIVIRSKKDWHRHRNVVAKRLAKKRVVVSE